MPRIRSVKPEYWLDPKTTRMTRDARLLYIALWNIADEHGRLFGDPRVIKGQTFPYDDDLTPDAIDALIDELAEHGKTRRYVVEGDSYLHLPKLAKHQRLEPIKVESRLPAPPDGVESAPRADKCAPRADKCAQEVTPVENESPEHATPVDEASQDVRADKCARGADSSEPIVVQQVAGSRWQGASGREQVAGVPPLRDAQTLVAEWLDHQDDRPPQRVIGQVAKEVKSMIGEAIPYADVRSGLIAWDRKGLHPSALASVVHEERRVKPTAARTSTTDDRVRQGMSLVKHFADLDADSPAAIEGNAQ